MRTYQDLELVLNNQTALMQFVLDAVSEFKRTEQYRIAADELL